MKYVVVCENYGPNTDRIFRSWQFSTLEAAMKEAEKVSNDLNATVVVAEVIGTFSRQTAWRENKRAGNVTAWSQP